MKTGTVKRSGNQLKTKGNDNGRRKYSICGLDNIILTFFLMIMMAFVLAAMIKSKSYGSRVREEQSCSQETDKIKDDLQYVIKEKLSDYGYQNAGVMVTEVVDQNTTELKICIHHSGLNQKDTRVQKMILTDIQTTGEILLSSTYDSDNQILLSFGFGQ